MEDTSSQLLEGRSACKACAEALIELASQRVYLITQALEPELYNYPEIYQLLAALARNSRKTDIRILAHDTRAAAQNGHHLIRLAQKLPSFVQIRTTVTPLDRKFSESWLIVDSAHLMRIRNPLRYEGYCEMDNKLEGRALSVRFIEIWEASQPDQNTRRLMV